MGFVQEFKAFAMRGNVVDMAVGIVIGAAFGKIVSSFVADVLMPPIGLVTGGVDFSDKLITLKEGSTAPDGTVVPGVTLNYGTFLSTILDFVIVAFAIFVLIKQVNRFLPKPAPAAAPAMKDCSWCATSIPAAAKRCPHCTSNL